jgi:hypothetical protein
VNLNLPVPTSFANVPEILVQLISILKELESGKYGEFLNVLGPVIIILPPDI